jgi:hypothetical protein
MSATIRDNTLISLEVVELSSNSLVSSGQQAATEKSEQLTRNPLPGYSGIQEHSNPFHSFLEYSTLFLFPFALGLTLYLGLVRLYEIKMVWWALVAVPIALIGGDLVTGLVHWFADTYFSEDTPIIGPTLVKPFRLHHVYPRDITTHSVVIILGNSCTLAVPVLGFCLYLLWLWPGSGLLALQAVCIALLAIMTVLTNQFHKWAHQEKPSGFVRWLQRSRLVLESSHHELHHTAPYNLHYCITNGWLNPLLNRIQFFRRLEALLRLFGMKPANAKYHQHG